MDAFQFISKKEFIIMTKRKISLIFLSMCLLLSALSQAPIIGKASELNFAVESIIPDNQRDKTKTFFDLRVAPKSEQVVELKLRNDTTKDVTVEPSVNSATTNLNGVVEYGATKAKKDSTLPIDLKEIVSVASEVTIPANQEIKLPITIKMPDRTFDGILAGGITIKEKDNSKSDSNTSSDTQGLAIQNKYAYVVALLLNQNDQPVEAKLELNDVVPSQVNARNVINANLHNVKSDYINSLDVEATITKKNESTALYTSSKKNMQMAPNSNFNYPISLNGEKLKAGKYTLKLNAQAKEGKWSFTKDFTISETDAKKYNSQDVSIKKDWTWVYILIGILLILIALFLIFFIIRRNRKKQEERRRLEAARNRKNVRRKKRPSKDQIPKK